MIRVPCPSELLALRAYQHSAGGQLLQLPFSACKECLDLRLDADVSTSRLFLNDSDQSYQISFVSIALEV
jgi:hypothetical protein